MDRVMCAGCSTLYASPYALGLWSCPVCKTGNDSTPTLAAAARLSSVLEQCAKPLSMRLGEALSRLTGKKPLYGYADKLFAVTCPTCSTVITMTNNVRSAQCSSCATVVQRS